MNFGHPAVLFGLVLGSIPIIVYYLMRFRSLRLPWGADYLLERALARLRRKLYLDQIILLALRALVVMALVVAFARPQSRRAGVVTTDGQVLRIVLVDGSYSMLAGDGKQTRRDAAFDALRQLVARWSRGEKWSLYALGRTAPWVVDRQDVVDAAHTLAIIDTLKVEESAVSLAAGLEAVLAHGAGQRREIYVFADDQASSWEGADRVSAATAANTRIFWIAPPLADRRNLAVTDLQLSHERVLRGHSFTAYVQVRNFSDQAVRDAELTLLVDNAVAAPPKRVSRQPVQTLPERIELRLDTPGPHLLTARLSTDALPFDNALSTGVEVADAITLLVLRDADRTGKFQSAAGWLELAANALAGGKKNAATGPLRVTVHTAPACPLAVLAPYDVVVLDGGRTLTPDLTDALRRYVDQGGGLVLAADDTYDRAAWCDQLGPARLLPAVPVKVTNLPIGDEGCRRLSSSGFELPALRDLATGTDGDVGRAQFFTWTEFGAPAPGAERLASFADGSPYAWRQRFERGSVLLLAAGLNCGNNTLMVCETMYPFLLHLFAEAASAGQYPRRVKPNEPVRHLAKIQPPPVSAMFQLDKDELLPANLVPQPQGTRVEYGPGASRSGPASLLLLRDNAREERIWFGAQGERLDSDLTPLAPAYRAQLAERFGWTEVAGARQLLDAVEAGGRGVERYGWVVLAVLIFAIGELLMGLRFV